MNNVYNVYYKIAAALKNSKEIAISKMPLYQGGVGKSALIKVEFKETGLEARIRNKKLFKKLFIWAIEKEFNIKLNFKKKLHKLMFLHIINRIVDKGYKVETIFNYFMKDWIYSYKDTVLLKYETWANSGTEMYTNDDGYKRYITYFDYEDFQFSFHRSSFYKPKIKTHRWDWYANIDVDDIINILKIA